MKTETEELLARLTEIEAWHSDGSRDYIDNLILALCAAVRELAAENERLKGGQKFIGFINRINLLKAENERLREVHKHIETLDAGEGYYISQHADLSGWSVWYIDGEFSLEIRAETPEAALKAWQEREKR